MFTRCPHCECVHAVKAADLAQASGSVRCNHCKQRFNALDGLHDDYPGQRDDQRPHPRGGGQPPLLGNPVALYGPRAPRAPGFQPVRPPPYRHRWAWITALVVLALLTAANAAWTFRAELSSHPAIARVLDGTPLAATPAVEATEEAGGVHLVSRDIHEHPSRAGVLVLSATFVSLADEPGEFPALWMSLVDADNRILAARDFQPHEYLPAGLDPESGLSPGVHVPMLLEFGDPGEKAVGFELEFH